MLRTTWASSRVLRVCVLGLATVTTAIIFTTDTADARRYRRHVRHEARTSYSPAFASIIVDANSGATLQSNNPDAIRRPASLTKIMTLYLLFERLEAGKMTLDTQMDVSEHASEQAPTKLGLKPGQTLKVEDAIKGLVTRSANDAAVVIAEAIAGDEDDFAKLMTRKARALGMSKTTYRNASGLPNDDQLTTARDQATLGRAIQDRFPRYYRYFATSTFVYRGHAIRNHNRLLGNVEGVDGIKTGYTRASGFNLVTSMRRGNRHLVGVVLGGRSGGSRDATMRNLLAENLEKGATKRTVAAISERGPGEANAEVAEADTASRRRRPFRSRAPSRFRRRARPRCDAADPFDRTGKALADGRRRRGPAAAAGPARARQGRSQAGARAAHQRRDPDPADCRDPRLGRADEAGPGQDGSGQGRRDEACLRRSVAARPARHPRDPAGPRGSRGDLATPSSPRPKSPSREPEPARAELPPQPAGHGTGNGVLGVLPASGAAPAPSQAMAYADPAKTQPQARAAERRHQAALAARRRGHDPQRMDHPGRRARERKRSPLAHRSRPQPGQGPAQQGRPLHRAGRCQG